MKRLFAAVALMVVPQFALAADVPWHYMAGAVSAKIETDEKAWFYLKICDVKDEAPKLLVLVQKYAGFVYRDDDTSDAAIGWRARFNGPQIEDFPKGSCEQAKSDLLKSIYAPAFRP